MSKFYNYSFSFSDLRIDTMVDTVHVSCSMERNRDIGAKDFYMVQMSSGEVEYRGTLSLQQVLTLVKEKYTHEAEADLSAQDLVDFSPVYKCLHIYTVLGEREEF